MAGSYKTHIKSLKPVVFLTFDDTMLWDPETGYLARGNEIFDESENGDPINALLHVDDMDAERYSYRFGQASLVDLQRTDSYSLVLAPNWYDSKNDFPFAKSIIELPYEDRIKFDKSFSISMIYEKYHNDLSQMSGYVWDSVAGRYRVANNNNDVSRVIFTKGNVYLRYHMPKYSTHYVAFGFPNNSGIIYHHNFPHGSMYGKYLFNMTHEHIVMDDGRYYTESKIYFDSDLVYSHTTSPVYGDYVAGNTSPIFFGGHQSAWDYNTLNDRTTTPTTFDQIAIFDYALNTNQISDIIKKTYSYETLISRARPETYYPMRDYVESSGFTNIMNSGVKRIYQIGNNNQVIKRQTGIHGIYGDSSTRVRDKGMLYSRYNTGNYNGSFFNPGGNFNIEFFASFNGSDRGCLMSLQEDVYPFRGIAIFGNSRDSLEKSGSIQLMIDDNTFIHTPEFNARGEPVLYNDGEFRHYSIARKGNVIEFKIDSVLIGTNYISSGSLTSTYNSLYMFGLSPNDLSLPGYIQHLAFYHRALSDMEIDMRVNYIQRYMITGRTTINGTGRPLAIRVYSFHTGQLLVDEKSYDNGEYNIRVPSSDYINVVFQDLKSTRVRPLVIGPTLADEYLDLPND